MQMVSKQERRAQTTMRVVTGFGGLLAVSLLMAAMPAQTIVIASTSAVSHGE